MRKSLCFTLVILSFGNRLLAAEKTPLIGITPDINSNTVIVRQALVTAVQQYGGTAIILTPTTNEQTIATYIEMLDGAVFSGGPDIPSQFYGQQPHPTLNPMHAERFEFERRFIPKFLDADKPVFAICLGLQFSNVCRGGTLIQDLPELVGTRVKHKGVGVKYVWHEVELVPDSLLNRLLQCEKTTVASTHHQAVDKLGRGFRVTARSSDGMIEGLERTDGVFGLFVQWHPEFMLETNPDHTCKLFTAFIRAAGKTNN